jgi:glycosyltransferase involved in cell wall biosynthesis
VVLNVRVVTGGGGGPDVTLIRSAPYFRRYWPSVAYMHPPHDAGFAALQRLAAAHDYPCIGIADRGPLDARVARELLALCRHLGVRIWHGRDYKANLLGLLLRRLHPMALVTTVHGWVTHTRRTPLYYAIDRRCLPRYDHVITVASSLHTEALDLGVAPDRCSLLLNAVDERVFSRRGDGERRTPSGSATERLLIGAVGRLSSEKAFADLIRAAAALIGDGHDIELRIAGEGPARRQLQDLVDALGVGQRVALLGRVEDTVALLQSLHVFALSSRFEGLPIALLEAMAMELPAVATAVGGVGDAIEDGDNGLLVPAGDVGALTAALRRLVQDPALRERLGRAARRTIEAQFTLSRRVAAEEAIYDRVLRDAVVANR